MHMHMYMLTETVTAATAVTGWARATWGPSRFPLLHSSDWASAVAPLPPAASAARAPHRRLYGGCAGGGFRPRRHRVGHHRWAGCAGEAWHARRATTACARPAALAPAPSAPCIPAPGPGASTVQGDCSFVPASKPRPRPLAAHESAQQSAGPPRASGWRARVATTPR